MIDMTIYELVKHIKYIVLEEKDVDKAVNVVWSVKHEDGTPITNAEIRKIIQMLKGEIEASNGGFYLIESDNSALLILINAIEAKLKGRNNDGK